MRNGMALAVSAVGWASAAFFAYVAIGGAIAMAIAEPYNADRTCWPHHTALEIVRTECSDTVADFAWYVLIETPRYLVVIPTLALAQFIQVIRTGSTYWLHDALQWTYLGTPVLIASVVGFFHLRARVAAAALLLLVLLAGQIVVSLTPHVTRELVEPMD